MDDWQVFLDIRLHRALRGWSKEAQIELDARQRVLRAKGPLAFAWPPDQFAGVADWAALEETFRRRFLLLYEEEGPVHLVLEVRPGKVLVIRPPD